MVREVERKLADTTARIEQERRRPEAALIANDANVLDVIESTLARFAKPRRVIAKVGVTPGRAAAIPYNFSITLRILRLRENKYCIL